MSAILLVHGTIRQTSPKAKRSDGQVFGTEVSILTEVGATLGETLKVLVFNAREGEARPTLDAGRLVDWVVEVEGNNFGLNATFRREATEDDIRRLAVGAGTPAWELTAAAGDPEMARA